MHNRAFVTGYPVTHSRSPLIHRYWLEKYALVGHYDPIEVAPENFKNFVQTLKEQGFCGGNVTLPHKEVAFQLADKKDDVALKIGAANTLWFEGETLCASNTDSYGFSANLNEYYPDWGGEIALVLGAGGASRAVIHALKERQFEKIIIVNRTKERAVQLGQHFNVNVGEWENMNDYVSHADFIVNTTSLGMENHLTKPKDELFIDLSKAKQKCLVTDIIYTPLQTPILHAAKKHGLKTVDGLGMLLHQAVPGFEKWFGQKPEVTKELRQLILNDLGNNE